MLAVVLLQVAVSFTPAHPGFDAATFDPIVQGGIHAGAYPGAAFVVGRRDTILFAKGYGRLTWSPSSRAVSSLKPGTTSVTISIQKPRSYTMRTASSTCCSTPPSSR